MRSTLALLTALLALLHASASFGASYSASYGTRIGGRNTESANGIVADASGNYYVGGWADVQSEDLPQASNSFSNTDCAHGCGFVFKFNAADQLVYSAWIAGLDIQDLALGPDGGLYLYGNELHFFPGEPSPITPGSYMTEQPASGPARILVKLRPDGSGIEYGTYFHTDFQNQKTNHVAVDRNGAAYLCGMAGDGWLTPAFGLPNVSGTDAFVAKISPDGARVEFVRNLGGSEPDDCYDLAVDGLGRAYIVGIATSQDFPLTHGRRNPGYQDAFVARLSATGDRWEYVTVVGGSEREWPSSVTLLDGSVAVVGGATLSDDFPGVGQAPQRERGGAEDGFVFRVDASGRPGAATYFGGFGPEGVTTLATGANGEIIAGGATYSYDLPTTIDGFQNGTGWGYRSGFVATLAPNLSTINYSSYLGGGYSQPMGFEGLDAVWSVAATPTGFVAAGSANTIDFPLLGTAMIPNRSGIADAQVFRFSAAEFVPEGPGLIAGLFGLPFEHTLGTRGGTGSVSWNLVWGYLPDGIELTDDGRLAGVIPATNGSPDGRGPYRFTLRATDAAGRVTYQNFSLLLATELKFDTPPPSAIPFIRGVESRWQIPYSGGFGQMPVRILLSDGVLPPGISLGTGMGISGLYGVPTQTGAYTFTIRIEDGLGQVLEHRMTVNVQEPAAPPPPPPNPVTGGGDGGGGGGGSVPPDLLLLLAAAAFLSRSMRSGCRILRTQFSRKS